MLNTTVAKLYNNTIPLRDKVVEKAIKQGGACVKAGLTSYILTPEHLGRPIRHIMVDDRYGKGKEKLMYFSLPKEQPPQLTLL